MATLASDDFNRADGGLGANWTDLKADAYAISSSKAVPSDVLQDSSAFYNATSFPNDQFAQATISTAIVGVNAGSGHGLAVRASGGVGTATLYRIYANANTLEADWFSGGTYQGSLGTRSVSFALSDVMRVEIEGTALRVYRNGSQLGADFSATGISSGKPGLAFSSAVTAGSLDDWSGGDLVTALATPIDIFDPIPFMSTGRI